MMSYNVVFVCTGNTCRSPMAEGLFNHRALSERLDAHAISCGLAAYLPRPASALAAEAVKPYGVDLSAHMSRPVTESVIGLSDAVFGMTEQHVTLLSQAFPSYAGKIRRLSADDIADPFGGDAEEYAHTAADLLKAVEELIRRFKKGSDAHETL